MIKINKIIKESFIVLLLMIIFIILIDYINVNVYTKTVIYEKKIDSEIDINRDFDVSSVIVVLKSRESQYRGVDKKITKKLLGIHQVISIEDLTELPSNLLLDEKTLIESSNKTIKHLKSIKFKQILKLNLNTKTKQDVLSAIMDIETLDEIKYVGPNYIYEGSSIIPNDIRFEEQWALNGICGIDICDAWNFSTGSSNIRVGIIDSGIASHEDLNENIYVGYDYVNNNTNTSDDVVGHGTCVAGIIGAVGNNNFGVSGINHKISLVPLQTVSDTSGTGYHKSEDVVTAIKIARDLWDTTNKIPILNYSIGGYGSDTYVLSAIEQYQGLFVWAAGNSGSNLDSINGIEDFLIDNLIVVGAHDNSNERSIWTNEKSSCYGSVVDIYAPGGSGNVQTDDNCLTTHSSSYSSYIYFNGTSCAAAHVTGVAALLLSLNPNLTTEQLKCSILNSAEIINISIPDGTTQNVKKLNAFNAVKYVLNNYLDFQSYNIDTNSTVNIDKNIGSNASFFNELNGFYELNFAQSTDYCFSISSTNKVNVTLFDLNYNIINITDINSSNNIVEFNKNFSSGSYYLKIKFDNEESIGTINVSGHSHSYEMQYYNYKWHKLTCECGQTSGNNQVHSILQSSIIDERYAPCIGCGYMLDLNSDMPIVRGLNTNVNIEMSTNGSYILPSGIIVLVDEDLDAYLNGTLVFNKKSKFLVIE